jgi:hypothetical protein
VLDTTSLETLTMLTFPIKPKAVQFTADLREALDFEMRSDADAARWWIEQLTGTEVGVFELTVNHLGGYAVACRDTNNDRYFLKTLGSIAGSRVTGAAYAMARSIDSVGLPATLAVTIGKPQPVPPPPPGALAGIAAGIAVTDGKR